MFDLLELATGASARRAAALVTQEPLVILSRGHSGSRVLTWLCARLGFELGSSESKPSADTDKCFTNRIKRIASRSIGIVHRADIVPADLRAFQRAVSSYRRRLGPSVSRWGWKFPETYLIVPLVTETFPNARFIHLLRDGRDVAFKKHLTDNPAKEPGRTILKACGALRKPHHVQAGMSWAFQVHQFEVAKAEISRDRLLEVQFEDLCANPLPVAERVASFLGVPMTDAARDYALREVDASKVGEHRRHDPAQVLEVEHHIRSTLKTYGYLA